MVLGFYEILLLKKKKKKKKKKKCNSSCVCDKIKSAVVVRNSQNLHQMQASKTALVAFLGKRFRALAYKQSKKQQWHIFPQPASKSS